MAARRCKISPRVLRNIFSTREEKFRISKRPCNVLFIIYKSVKYQTISLLKIVFCGERRNLSCSHSNGDFSLVKITRYFLMWSYHVFARKLSWYFIGVYTMKWCNVFRFAEEQGTLLYLFVLFVEVLITFDTLRAFNSQFEDHKHFFIDKEAIQRVH